MNHVPPTLDMTPDGGFRRLPPAPGRVPASFKLLVGAVILAVVAGAVTVAALALWVVSLMLPVLVLAAAGAYAMVKYRRWQSLRGARNLRPL
ncbi:MAG: hypothetical protein NVSMB18_11650 [Acetobacteraceae bacterium]